MIIEVLIHTQFLPFQPSMKNGVIFELQLTDGGGRVAVDEITGLLKVWDPYLFLLMRIPKFLKMMIWRHIKKVIVLVDSMKKEFAKINAKIKEKNIIMTNKSATNLYW